MNKELNFSNRDAGFTLTDLLVCLAVLSILASLAIPVHLDALERAKAVEATEALSEVVRLQQLYHTEKGSYTSDFKELGFQLTPSLKYTELFIEVHKDAKGWSYLAFATPLHGSGWMGCGPASKWHVPG